MPDKSSIIGVGLACLVLAGCAASGEDTPSPASPVSTPSAETTSDLASQTSTLSPTRTPKPTLTPSPTPTATPDVPLAPDGPWLVFMASALEPYGVRHLWAINADGSGLKELVGEDVVAFDAQPVDTLKDEVLIAYATQTDYESRDLELKLLSLPDGQIKTIATLIHDNPGDPAISPYDAATAVESGGLRWSRDGRQLAFVGQIDGPSMDVYVYDLDTQAITRISSGDDQAYYLRWSPNGMWIIHEAFEFLGMGGPESSGIWAARNDGSGSISLVEGLKDANGSLGTVWTGGWWSDFEILLIDRGYDEESTIQAVNITSGEAQTLVRAPFNDFAYAPDHATWLLAPPDSGGGTQIPVRMVRNGELIDIADYVDLLYVWWSREQGEFLAMTDRGQLYTVSVSGTMTELPVSTQGRLSYPGLYEAPDSTLWAWFTYDFYGSDSELWIGEPLKTPVEVVADVDMTIRSVTWSPDSQRLFMLTDRGLWVVEPPDLNPSRLVENLYMNPHHGWDATWLP